MQEVHEESCCEGSEEACRHGGCRLSEQRPGPAYPIWFGKRYNDKSSDEIKVLWNWCKLLYPDYLYPESILFEKDSLFLTSLPVDAPDANVPGVYEHDDTKLTNPKDRLATNRLDLSLFPATARAYGAIGMTEGDCKYGGYNYREFGVSASVYYAACGRHFDDWYNGEWADRKTGVPHLASALACIAIIIDSYAKGNLVDDRPPTVDFRKLLDDAEVHVKRLHELFPAGPARFTEVAHNVKS